MNKDRPISVVLADDAVLIRTGLARLLREEGFEVLAEVGDHDALLSAVRTFRPDLVVTDIRMPPTLTNEGLRAAATLRIEMPQIAVLVLSQHIEPSAAALLLANNPSAVGYLLKERVADLDEFIAACRTVAGGGSIVDRLVTEALIARHRTNAGIDRLTPREQQVLDLMAQGRSNAAIGRELFSAEKTVEAQIRSIFVKLGLTEQPDDNRRVSAVVRWLEASL